MQRQPEPQPVEILDPGRLCQRLDIRLRRTGSGNRLDFTCIGQAVNLAARMEKLAGRLGRVILASSEFARHCGAEFAALGEFTLAGFGAPQQIFGRASGVSNQDSLGATGIISPG